jgi:ATP phosphoribosyltransferase regulatory subunit
MPGRSKSEREALERQNAAIMAVFERAGFEHIAPDILQPADLFLESSGEDIRARTYVFTDPSGTEMCLRPDLTVPACRYHLSHAASPDTQARYCYCGPAFRYAGPDQAPGEFVQAGLEWYAAPEPEAAEARILKLALGALESAGLTRYRVILGDLALFDGLLAGIAMPSRWRQRLRRHFWRPLAFRDLLDHYAAVRGTKRTSISDDIDRIGATGDAEAEVAAILKARGLPLVGGRDVGEIAQRLKEKFADRSATPLAIGSKDRLADYLAREGDAESIAASLGEIEAGPAFARARAAYARRLAEMEELGLNPRRFRFAATFGRELEYYTGFVFQVEADGIAVAGGGRYDNLLSDIGSPMPVPAVGCAIHTDRLKQVLG